MSDYEKLGVFYLSRYHDPTKSRESTTCNQVSRIDEGEGDFRVRLSQASREQRDAATAKLRASESVETIELRPNKTNISVKLVTLAWTPHVRAASGQWVPAV